MRDIMLSVCVVSYNHEKYIEECLDHILSQKTDFKMEILFGDDCSTDNTLQIVRQKYVGGGTDVQIIEREENLGLCKNMYDLFLRARGKYVYLMDGDDYLYSDEILQKQVDFLETHDDYFSVTSREYIFKPSENSWGKVEIRTGDYTIKDYLEDGIVPCSYGTMRNIFCQDRANNEFLIRGAKNSEEILMWMYTMDKGKKYILPDYMRVYRYMTEGADSYNARYTFEQMFRHSYLNYSVIKRVYGKKYDMRPFKLKIINRFCLKIADSPRRFLQFMSILSNKDKIEFILYKIYLKTHNYRNPVSWSKKSCILSER